MGNCTGKSNDKQNGSAFDRVTSRTSTEDDCLLYQLADYQKGGDLIKFFAKEGGRATEDLLREQIPMLLYRKGEGQIVTRADYLKWKYRGKGHVGVPVNEDVPGWKDHKACWSFDYRGSLGESLLHVLIVCNTSMHFKLARMLIMIFPNLALDVVEGNEFRGASALHLAIAYNNLDLIKMLVEAGAGIEQRAVGSFFLPRDQQRARPSKTTDYEGLAYFGEFPLAWAACCNNESAYNLLIDRGADPNSQDSFGNMVLHMVVVCDKLEMYGYALRHPRLPAKMGLVNKAGLTPLTLSCHLGRATIFREMLELTAKEFWRYSNITCSAYPLNALDTILPDGRCNMTSALMIILNGTKEEHLDMLDGGIIQRLLEEKWKTFARMQFLKRLGILFFHLLALSAAVYSRPSRDRPLMDDYDNLDASDFARFCFEITTILSCIGYVVVQQSSELKNLGLRGFLSQLSHNPAKAIFLASNILTLACIPCRLMDKRDLEEAILIFAVPSAWFFLMFFAGAIRLTGPFVTMIYSMITGDMLTFAIIYAIMLLAFSQAIFYLHRGHPDRPPLFSNFLSTWMGLFQWTLGDYNYSSLGETIYPGLTKIVFVIFMIMVPILLLNMLIAMMGNTYALVIQQSEKEWVKQWAKIVIALERAVSQVHAKDYLVTYSIKVSGGSDGSDGTPPQEEVRGVMVIKSKNKTRARQRKGALNNWKRVGKVTIQVLKRRGITGEDLRRQIWEPRTPSTTSVNVSPSMTPIPCPTSAAILLMDMNGGNGLIGGGVGVVEHNNMLNGDPFVEGKFNFGLPPIPGPKPNTIIPINEPLKQEAFNEALQNKISVGSMLIEDRIESSYTAPVAASVPETIQPSILPIPTVPIEPAIDSILPPLTEPYPVREEQEEAEVIKMDNGSRSPDSLTQLSDLENEIIAQTLLSNVVQQPNHVNLTSISSMPTEPSSPKDSLPPLFKARLLDTPTQSMEADPVNGIELRRQSTPAFIQRTASIDLSGPEVYRRQEVNRKSRSVVDHQPTIIIDKEEKKNRLPPLVVDDKLLVATVDSSSVASGKGHKKRLKSRSKLKHQFSRNNVIAPSDGPVYQPMMEDELPLAPDTLRRDSSPPLFERLRSNHTQVLARASTLSDDKTKQKKKLKLKSISFGRRNSGHESAASSSGVDESLYTATRVSSRKKLIDSRSSSEGNIISDAPPNETPIVADNNPPVPLSEGEEPLAPSEQESLMVIPQQETLMIIPQQEEVVVNPQMEEIELPPVAIFHISGRLEETEKESEDIQPVHGRGIHSKSKTSSSRRSYSLRRPKVTNMRKLKLSLGHRNKKPIPDLSHLSHVSIVPVDSPEKVEVLSSTSTRIDQVKADHFHSSAAVMNMNSLLDSQEESMAAADDENDTDMDI